MTRSRPDGPRPLAVLHALLVAATLAAFAALPSCHGNPCDGGVEEVCKGDDESSCVCAAPCANQQACDAADPSTRRFCFFIRQDEPQGRCLPADHFQFACGGTTCTGALCDGTICRPLCRHSTECSDGCCAQLGAANSVCVAPAGAGYQHPAGTCLP